MALGKLLRREDGPQEEEELWQSMVRRQKNKRRKDILWHLRKHQMANNTATITCDACSAVQVGNLPYKCGQYRVLENCREKPWEEIQEMLNQRRKEKIATAT
jgi:hypothetical protein